MTIENKTGVADPVAETAEGQKTVSKNPEVASKKVASEKPDVAGKSLIEVYKELRGLNNPKKSEVKAEDAEDDKIEVEDSTESDQEEVEAKTKVETDGVSEGAEGEQSEKAVDEEEDADSEGLPNRAKKRIGKLTAEKADLERRLKEALEGKKVPEAEVKKPEQVPALAEIESKARNLRSLIRQIDALRIDEPLVDEEGRKYWEAADGKGGVVKLTAKQLSTMRLQYSEELEDKLPAEYARLSQKVKVQEESKKLMDRFSWMKDENSEGRKRFENYKNLPQYANFRSEHGESEALMALVVEGELSLEAKEKSFKREKPLERKTYKPPVPRSAPASDSNEDSDDREVLQGYRKLQDRVKATGSREDAIKLLAYKSKHKLT